MLVTKKTITNQPEMKRIMDTIKDYKNAEMVNFDELPDVIFHFKVVGRRTLEFCIVNDEGIVDMTNKIIVEKLATFKWGTAKEFSKTFVKKWNKLFWEDDGEFEI